ncbi:MAG TPA: hypothetical protein VG737_13635 [Cyclobacteriaceae bacterium]|nr:hypothetical protein [Cyclobacteriaceae bacterium]
MKFKHVGVILPAFMALAFSCTIIQDSDIKSAADISNLKLVNITISQATLNGQLGTGIMPLIDKTVSISTPQGMITRYVEMGAPSFPTNSKMKYRASVPDNAKLYIYYFSTGKPSTLGIYKENIVNGKVKDSTFYEIYRFRYDANGRVNKFTTFLDPISSATSNDTLIYTGNRVTTVNRKAGTQATTVTVQYQDAAVNNINVSPTGSQTITKNIYFGGSSCSTCVSESYSSLGYNQTGQGQNNGGGNNQASLTITLNSLVGKPQSLILDNELNLGYAPDTYYFHPLMILNGLVPQGNALLHIYMIDWWKLGASLSGSSTSNNPKERVNFTFNYGTP